MGNGNCLLQLLYRGFTRKKRLTRQLPDAAKMGELRSVK
jgi:hypothetical protein